MTCLPASFQGWPTRHRLSRLGSFPTPRPRNPSDGGKKPHSVSAQDGLGRPRGFHPRRSAGRWSTTTAHTRQRGSSGPRMRQPNRSGRFSRRSECCSSLFARRRSGTSWAPSRKTLWCFKRETCSRPSVGGRRRRASRRRRLGLYDGKNFDRLLAILL